MKRFKLGILVVSLVAVLCLALASAQKKEPASAHKSHSIITPDSIKWGPAPASWIRGTPPPELAGAMKSEFAVIQGDPSKPGTPFTVRIKSPDGAKVAPHWHPQDEHLTILRGTFVLGMGEKFDQAAGHELTAGSFAVVPKKELHFAWTKGETIIQVHGMGPFVINFGKPGEESKKTSSSQ